MNRCCGVLMPVFSLPSRYGAGSFGKECFDFIDFLKKSNVKVWQVLPLVQTGYGNSPYSSVSSSSLNPYFISIEELIKDGLIKEDEADFSLNSSEYVDYGFLYSVRFPLLKKAFSRFDKSNADFVSFCKNKTALDYAIFMTLKYESGQKHFYEWDDKYKYREDKALSDFANSYREEIDFWQFVQFVALNQWLKVKQYANLNGIKILGDMPLYVALDSVDVWTNPHYFKLQKDFTPIKVAGVPPDYFCAEGQLWGNPVYDYAKLKEDNFSWWVDRLSSTLKLFDYIRIDHFRGLDRYYEVPFGEKTAINGEWVDVPSDELFTAIFNKIERTRIIAEDLGIIDDGVRNLLSKLNLKGMKVLSFAFNGEENNLYLPQNITENSVAYTGTHDNDTLKGLITKFSEWDYNNLSNGVKNSLKLFNLDLPLNTVEDYINAIIELGCACKSDLFVVPMQDILKKDSNFRINEPATVKPQNWAIRFNKNDFSDSVSTKLKGLIQKYDR